MKILITSDWYLPAVNGVVTSVVNLRRELLRRGHEVRVLTLSGNSKTQIEGGIYALGSLDAGLIYPGARLRSAAVGDVARELVAWQPDVVHSQCEFSTFELARRIARAAHAPLIHTYHTVYEDYTHYFSPSRRWGRCMAKGFSRTVLHKTNQVIAPTEKVQQLLADYGIDRPVTVIPTGIDLSRFTVQPTEEWKAERRAQLGIPTQNKVLVYVGRLAKEKNVDELLACRARMGNVSVTLLLVGGGPQQAELMQQAERLGLLQNHAVVFAGMIPPTQVAAYYHLGDVFVSASTSETQGLTYIEALAAGLPAVCRADACLAGVIEDGVNGLQYQTTGELDRFLQEVLSRPELCEKLSRRAVLSAERFSATRFAARVAELYCTAVAEKAEAAYCLKKGGALWQRA